jgi:hypothetical protein
MRTRSDCSNAPSGSASVRGATPSGRLRAEDALAADAHADACAAIRDLTLVVERLAQRSDARDQGA